MNEVIKLMMGHPVKTLSYRPEGKKQSKIARKELRNEKQRRINDYAEVISSGKRLFE